MAKVMASDGVSASSTISARDQQDYNKWVTPRSLPLRPGLCRCRYRSSDAASTQIPSSHVAAPEERLFTISCASSAAAVPEVARKKGSSRAGFLIEDLFLIHAFFIPPDLCSI